MDGHLTLPSDEHIKHAPSGRASLKKLSKAQRTCAVRRAAYARACVPLYPVGPLSRRLRTAIEEEAARIHDTRPPSPHSVYRWVRRYVLSNFDTAVFVQDAGAIRQRKPRIATKTQDLLREEIQRLLGGHVGATLNGVMNEALATVAQRLGYLKFKTKEGIELTPEEYLSQLRANAKAHEGKKRDL